MVSLPISLPYICNSLLTKASWNFQMNTFSISQYHYAYRDGNNIVNHVLRVAFYNQIIIKLYLFSGFGKGQAHGLQASGVLLVGSP